MPILFLGGEFNMVSASVVLWKLRRIFQAPFSQSQNKTFKYPKAILDEERSSHHTKWYSYMTKEQMKDYYKEDELRAQLETAILERYPTIKDLEMAIYNNTGFYHVASSDCDRRMSISVRVCWVNGINKSFIYKIVDDICNKHFASIPQYENEHWQGVETIKWKYHIYRTYSDDVILNAARRYANHISDGLPISMGTVGQLMIAGVSLQKLALNDLEMLDQV